MPEISLSKALKMKNRLAGRLNKTTSLLTTYNSMPQGRTAEVNIRDLDNERGDLVEALVELKTEIGIANKNIVKDIFLLGEKKSEVDYLNTLNTRNGSEPTGYNGTIVVYIAVITKEEASKRIKKLEKEIDEIQDNMDKHNAITKIRVSQKVLDLAS